MTGGPDVGPDPYGLQQRLVDFVTALRTKGIMVGTGETVDAAEAMTRLGLDERSILREGLAGTLTRKHSQRETFDEVFDIYFPPRVGRPRSAEQVPADFDVETLRDMLVETLAVADLDALGELAEIAVDRFGEIGGDPAGWSAKQTLDRVQPQNLLARTMGLRGDDDAVVELGGVSPRDQVRDLIGRFRERVEDEARRRTSETRGRERMVLTAVQAQTEHVDFLSANAEQLEEMRRGVRALARRLATRLSVRRRRSHRNTIDIRRTMRKSMSTGGTPIDLVFAKPRPSRPDLVLLCDVSSSVSGFSGFTMLLVQAMKNQFKKVKVYAFVNAMADVTELISVDGDEDGAGLQARILEQAHVQHGTSSSDYGAAFAEFVARDLESIGSRSSVLILGDARTNYREPGLDDLREIRARSNRTFWLNPEQENIWGTGDSAAFDYADVVEMHECRSVEQLGEFVSRLLPA
ncbi:VWA domain-containing protein [Gryllotalpicola sp.]|uniref:VWA domain-containing protein n=1 Tax=Gryllotalpicola sp. TaxID=1932787 RepID=UPI002635B199|nr:VWA domain-containing protein [Gryllotalpicola sp.]